MEMIAGQSTRPGRCRAIQFSVSVQRCAGPFLWLNLCPIHVKLQSPMVTTSLAIPLERIERRILLIRGQKVLLSTELAKLYEVAPKALVQAVKRNRRRFPEDFMFQLTEEEYEILKSQFVTSSWGGARRARPYAFTEQGVAMLSSVLRSERAVQVNIAIMRAFVKLREMLASHRDLARRLTSMEKKYDARFKVIFDALRELMRPPRKPSRGIGFRSQSGPPA